MKPLLFQREDFVWRTTLIGIIVFLLALLLPSAAGAEGSIGLSYSQVVDDVSIGATATYEKEFAIGELETSAQAQTGDLFLADAHANFTFDVGPVGFRPYVDTTGKGNTLDDLGGKLDYGITLNVPLHKTAEVGIGVFLRNANPFAEKVLYELVDGEYQPVDAGFGINYDNPAKLNITSYTGLEVWRFDVKLSGSMGLGDVRDYWLIVDATTGFDLAGIAELSVGFNLGNRWWTDDAGADVSKADLATILSLNRNW